MHRFACLGLGSASAALCLSLASVSNQARRPSLGLVIFFGSAQSWSFSLDLAKSTWASYISEICSVFGAFGKWVLCLNCCKRQTLLLNDLRVCTFCFFLYFYFHASVSICFTSTSGWLPLLRSRLALFPAFTSASEILLRRLPRPLPRKMPWLGLHHWMCVKQNSHVWLKCV